MESEVQSGQLIAGKYRMQQVLGRGGMGVVVAALHEQLNQRVALKFLTDNAFQQPEAVARFLREARAAVQIQSEHVARVMDVGTLDSGAPYMVMEYLRGLDLKEVSTRRGQIPITEAVDYVLQACDAVAEAHSLGIVHRDLKPSNLFLTERPDGSPLVKVLDFGISKALHAPGGETSQQQMTASAAIMGSPQYMSPEQIRSSKSVDARSDIWALGTILHELLAGAPAYVADTVPGLLAMIVADPPPPLSASRPDAPADLEAAILRCLQKDREHRFTNVAEFARALERFASTEARPLVRRIARVLGDNPPAIAHSNAPVPSAHGLTFKEPSSQTNGTWARTGRLSDGVPRKPAYRKTSVQLGVGIGFVGLTILTGFLWARRTSEGPEAFDGASASGAVAPASGVAPTPATNGSLGVPPKGPGVGLVRPGPGDVPAPLPTLLKKKAETAADDIEPAAGGVHIASEDGSEPSTPPVRPKKNAAAGRSPRARANPVKPPRNASVAARAPKDAAVSPAATPKKTNTLDLFNDTK